MWSGKKFSTNSCQKWTPPTVTTLLWNSLPDTKRLLIKQTSHCAHGLSKSKSPAINKKGRKKKKILFAFLQQNVWEVSLNPPAEKVFMSKFKVSKSSGGKTINWSNQHFVPFSRPLWSNIDVSVLEHGREFPRAPWGETNQWVRLKATEWKCLRGLRLDPSFDECTHLHTHTRTHQVRSFDRVHSLPVPLSAPHPGRNQTHHTFLCRQNTPPPNLPSPHIPTQQEFTCTGLRREERAPPATIYSSALGSGTRQNTACRLRGKKTFVTPVYTTICWHHRPYFPKWWITDSAATYNCYTRLLTFPEGKLCFGFLRCGGSWCSVAGCRQCRSDLEIRSQHVFTNWPLKDTVNCTALHFHRQSTSQFLVFEGSSHLTGCEMCFLSCDTPPNIIIERGLEPRLRIWMWNNRIKTA